jgi:hypothetical protein
MKRTLIFVLIAGLGMATTLAASDARTLSAEIESATLKAVSLEAGVGDVDISIGSGPMVIATVQLRPRRGGLFSSLKAAEKQVQKATFEPSARGGTLRLEITGVEGDRRFDEEWTLILPAHLDLSVELGVGDIEVSNTTSGLDLEVGVGEVAIKVNGGPVDVEVGVGDITVRGPVAAYRSVEVASGVGDVRIIADGRKIIGEGFIAHSAEWRGSGDATIEAECGVGEVRIILE